MSPIAVGAGIPLSAVAAIIVSMGTVHTFLNYIPSALIGAPDGDTALALLPGHRMLISGHAAQGVAYSARGSQLGLLLSIPTVTVGCEAPVRNNPGLGLYELSRDILPGSCWPSPYSSSSRKPLDWPGQVGSKSQQSGQDCHCPNRKEFTFHIGKWRIYRKIEAIDFRLGDNSRAAGMLVATAFFCSQDSMGGLCSITRS